MSKRVVVDPITRIEGHLRIEAQTAADGTIERAYSAGTMVRGIETILQGRDPRDAWAFAQRICGVCTLVHGLASVRSVEDALDYQIPANANLIRNLMIAAQYVHDHVMHFYHLHALDWVDVVSCLSADPKATSEIAQSISSHAKSSPGYFADVQKKIKGFVEGGQLGIFANGYWGHPEYKLPPEVNLLAVAHYLEALEWQRDVVRLHTILGGKNPHPNFVVGGAPSPISIDPSAQGGVTGTTALNVVGLQEIRDVIVKMQRFVDQVYIPDTLAIAGFYKDWFRRGGGVANYLVMGDMPENGIDDPSSYLFPPGVILGRDLNTIHEVDLTSRDQVKEFIAHSWYQYSVGNEKGLHPWDGETTFGYKERGGPEVPYKQLDIDQGYSWLKSPRWNGKPVEVGPLARMLVLYANRSASQHEQAKALVDASLAQLELPLDALFSTMGRTAARTLETKIVVDKMLTWHNNLIDNIKKGDLAVFNDEKWEPSSWPKRSEGVGFMEAPRGALSHFIVIEEGKIANYQAVVPSTWNAGPMDSEGQHGPYEASLMDNHQLHDPTQPLEVLRTVHSFDPCIACAVHLTDPEGEEMMKVKVR